MNKKGQVLDHPIIFIIFIIIGLLVIAPIMLKVMNEIKTPISAQLGNVTGGEVAQTNFNSIMTTGINMWDKVVIFAFFLGLILMFVSAFLIDAHPFFIILYIFIAFFTVLFAPNIVDAIGTIYDSPQFALESSQLSFMVTLKDNFGAFLVGIIIITGIIIYGKIRLFPSGNNRGT